MADRCDHAGPHDVLEAALALGRSTMPIKRPPHRRSPAFRRRVVLALAAAEERITRAYASAATTFLLDLTDDLPFDHALDIFMRLTSVPPTLRHAVTV